MDQAELPRNAIYHLDISLQNITKINPLLMVFCYFASGFPDIPDFTPFKHFIVNVAL
jgi:hypothetical protein